eukprot:scaffold194427_cov40-Tisochrysis_lutea.AAC.2
MERGQVGAAEAGMLCRMSDPWCSNKRQIAGVAPAGSWEEVERGALGRCPIRPERGWLCAKGQQEPPFVPHPQDAYADVRRGSRGERQWDGNRGREEEVEMGSEASDAAMPSPNPCSPKIQRHKVFQE